MTEMRILKSLEEKVMDPEEKSRRKRRQEAIKRASGKVAMCVISCNLSTSIHNHECRKLGSVMQGHIDHLSRS